MADITYSEQRNRTRVYVKKQVRLDRLDFDQTQMLRLGNVAVAEVKNRVLAGRDENDAPAKPLNKRYAITKSRVTGRRAIRDLSYSGNMLRNFQVRSVSQNRAYASLTSRKERIKAQVTNKTQRWIVYSPANEQRVREVAEQILGEIRTRRLVLEKVIEG